MYLPTDRSRSAYVRYSTIRHTRARKKSILSPFAAWQLLTYDRLEPGTQDERSAAAAILDAYRDNPVIKLNETQVRTLAAMAEAAGILHQKAQNAITIPEKYGDPNWRYNSPDWLRRRPSHIQSGTKVGKRPDTGANLQASGEPQERGVHRHPGGNPTSQEALERPLGGVRQDKDRNSCDRAASPQPAAVNKFTRSQATSRFSARSTKGECDNRRAVPVQVWVSPLVKDELSRIASSDGLSLSSAGAALLTRGLQQNVDMQYGALLRPIIETVIAKQIAGIATRLTWLLVRIAFDAGQTRSLITNILGRQQGVTQPLLKTILDSSARSAKANIMRRTPQISDLINSVEQWMLQNDRGECAEKTHD